MSTAPADRSGNRTASPGRIARPLVDDLVARCATSDGSTFVGLDGRSGAGKSTLAAALASVLSDRHGIAVTVIEGDQFYAGGSADHWDARSSSAKADQVIDWQRQRTVLEDLGVRGRASWFPFDWEAPDWDADPAPLRAAPMSTDAAAVVVLEGAYSARPELHDLLDVRVLLDTPSERQRCQLLEREGDAYRDDWEARWSAAEDHYFGTVMPRERFDLVL